MKPQPNANGNYTRLALPHALQLAAALVGLGASLEYLLLGLLLSAPFAVAALLLALSFLAVRRPSAAARATVALAVTIPLAALVAAVRGAVPIGVPVFDALLFAWLAYCAWPAVRSA